MSRRLEVLEKLVASGTADPFAHYGLAMEYRRLERLEDAERVFATLREKAPDYLPMYLMAGQMLLAAGRATDAAVWLEQGVALAERLGDRKALSELEAALGEAASS